MRVGHTFIENRPQTNHDAPQETKATAVAPQKSPIYFLIDIVTISDCLEAATDRLGRNYSKTKVYDTLIQEFEKGAGTHYNAELVDLIKEHPDVYAKMKYIVEKAWINNYYDIYKNFFVEKK